MIFPIFTVAVFSMHKVTALYLHLISVALGAVTAVILLRRLRRLWKRRQLQQKITTFRQQEEKRREVIKQQLVSIDEVRAKLITSIKCSEIVKKLASGELKAVEVLQAYQRIALKVNDDINAVTEFIETAVETAKELDQKPASERHPLHGIPFSVKECLFVKGTEATLGHSQFLGVSVNFKTAPLVEFLQWLGAVPFAKTNIPQAVYAFETRNPIHGTTKNPLDNTRSPGGSTGGEGALIGAMASPFGLGSDVAGSLRTPSAWCGLCTLKPTSNRALRDGDFCVELQGRIIWNDFFSYGFITRDVDTLVMLHRLLYNEATFQHFSDVASPMAPIPFGEDIFTSNDRLTIAYCEFDGIVEPVPAVKRVLFEARQCLERRGHRLVPWHQVFHVDDNQKAAIDFLKSGYMLYLNTLAIDGLVDMVKSLQDDVEISAQNKMSYYALLTPRWLKWLFSKVADFTGQPLTSEMIANLQPGKKPHDLNILFRRVATFRRQFVEACSAANVDALLWPAVPFPAPPLETPRNVIPAKSYAALFNLLNWPAGVCPFGKVIADDEFNMANDYPTQPKYKHDDMLANYVKSFLLSSIGLPLAVQIAAPPFKEEVVLRLMKELSNENETKKN